uniref:Uncharacterized protein n=1 Tax=Equus asinus TaxID=9793 RepID=A0A8C4LRR4_EQUAS
MLSSPKTKQGEQQLAGEMTEVLPAGAHIVPKDRRLTCPGWGVLSERLSLNADVLMFNHTYNLVHSKRISHTMEVLLLDQNFVEKMETLEARLVAPTPSSDLWVHSEFTAFPGQTPPQPPQG